ncbi:Cell polarity protein [Erysiphe necator]|nr:Cell polarity protein [Erysiphe necator]
MSLSTKGDIPLQIISENSSSERRINPSWTITQLKLKLEPVTGIPSSSQELILRTGDKSSVTIMSKDEDQTTLETFLLVPYSEINVRDLRPVAMRPNYTDTSQVPKFEISPDQYEKMTDSVLAWKKANKLGRFDPHALHSEEKAKQVFEREIQDRGIEVGRRCRIDSEDLKRGTVMYVGEVQEISSGVGKWVGIRLDEPVGKNDGSLGGKRYWGKEGDSKSGVFVRPQRVEIGEFPVIDDLNEAMEEI